MTKLTNNIFKSKVTSIIGLLVAVAALVSHFVHEPNWLNTGLGLTIAAAFILSPDKLFGKFLGVGTIALLLASCNPVKRVMNDQEKFDIVAKEAIRRGYCSTDTTAIDTSTVVTYRDTLYLDTIQTKLSTDCDIDTIVDDVHLVIDSGLVSIKNTRKEKTVINNVVKTVEDKARINVLTQDLKKSAAQLDSAHKAYLNLDKKLLTSERSHDETKKDFFNFKAVVYGGLAAVGLIIFLFARLGLLRKIF